MLRNMMNSLPPAVKNAVESHLGSRVTEVARLSGGDVSAVFRVVAGHGHFVVKVRGEKGDHPALFFAESQGLHLLAQTRALAVAIYVNFFAHHWLPDARWLLFAATVAVFGRTWISYRITRVHRMPLVVAAGLSSLMLWIAENVGTRSGTWLYSGQGTADIVSFAKIGSWYLLLYVSFVTVALAAPSAIRAPTEDSRARPEPTARRRQGSSART